MTKPRVFDTLKMTINSGLEVIKAGSETIKSGALMLELNAKASLMEATEEYSKTFSQEAVIEAKRVLEAMREF